MDGVGVLESGTSDVFSEIDTEEKKRSSLSDLFSFLKLAYQPSDFKKVQQVLRLHEEKFVIEKEAMRLEIEKDSEELMKKEIAKFRDLEKEVEAYRNRCLELEEKNVKAESDFRVLATELETKEKEANQRCIDLETKLRELEFNKFGLEGELQKYKNATEDLEMRNTRLEEDHRVACEREQSEKEKIMGLLKEVEKSEKVAIQENVLLKMENQELECGKRRAERDIEDYKRRYEELNSWMLGLEEDNEVCCVEQGKGSCKASKNQNEERQNAGMERVDAHMQFEGKKSNYKLKTPLPADARFIKHSPDGGSEVLQVADGKDEKRIDSIAAKEGCSRRVKKQLLFEPGGSSDRMVASVMPSCAKSVLGVIEINDSEDEMDMIPALTSNVCDDRTSNVRHDGMVHVLMKPALGKTLGNGMDMALQDKSNKDAGEENDSSCEEKFFSIPTPKRKRASKVIASDSEDDDDDGIPISKLRTKKLKDLNDGVKQQSPDSPLFQSGKVPTTCSGAGIIGESLTPSRRRLVSLRQCEETKGKKITSPSQFCAQKILPDNENVMSGTNVKDDEVEDIESDSDSEGESLGGFIVDESDGSVCEHGSDVSENLVDSDSALDEVIARIRRSKDSSNWEYEADMLSSFSKDPELCMKAVCALYRQQTSEEISMKGSLYINGRGFNKFDAHRASSLADFLTEGEPHGLLKKSVKDLEKHDPKALDYCCKLASRYSKQLFEIYRNKEDPFFLPS